MNRMNGKRKEYKAKNNNSRERENRRKWERTNTDAWKPGKETVYQFMYRSIFHYLDTILEWKESWNMASQPNKTPENIQSCGVFSSQSIPSLTSQRTTPTHLTCRVHPLHPRDGSSAARSGSAGQTTSWWRKSKRSSPMGASERRAFFVVLGVVLLCL